MIRLFIVRLFGGAENPLKILSGRVKTPIILTPYPASK